LADLNSFLEGTSTSSKSTSESLKRSKTNFNKVDVVALDGDETDRDSTGENLSGPGEASEDSELSDGHNINSNKLKGDNNINLNSRQLSPVSLRFDDVITGYCGLKQNANLIRDEFGEVSVEHLKALQNLAVFLGGDSSDSRGGGAQQIRLALKYWRASLRVEGELFQDLVAIIEAKIAAAQSERRACFLAADGCGEATVSTPSDYDIDNMMSSLSFLPAASEHETMLFDVLADTKVAFSVSTGKINEKMSALEAVRVRNQAQNYRPPRMGRSPLSRDRQRTLPRLHLRRST